VGGDESLRLFCALRLPDDVVESLVRWQRRELRGRRTPPPGERIVPPSNLHLTLAFLGHRPAGDAPGIGAALRTAAGEAADLRLTLRGYRETRSVGMLVLEDADGAAAALAADLHARLQQLGVYEPERRAWLPHLSVVRFRERPRLRPRLPDLGEMSPSEAAVYHSVLRPTGARYVILQGYRVGPI
jgi:2'-5' RNA ligase